MTSMQFIQNPIKIRNKTYCIFISIEFHHQTSNRSIKNIEIEVSKYFVLTNKRRYLIPKKNNMHFETYSQTSSNFYKNLQSLLYL